MQLNTTQNSSKQLKKQLNAAQYSSMQFETVQNSFNSSMQLNTAQCISMQLNRVQRSQMRLNTAQCSLQNHWIRLCFAQCALYDESSKFCETQHSAPYCLIQLNAAQYNSKQLKTVKKTAQCSSIQLNAVQNYYYYFTHVFAKYAILLG